MHKKTYLANLLKFHFHEALRSSCRCRSYLPPVLIRHSVWFAPSVSLSLDRLECGWEGKGGVTTTCFSKRHVSPGAIRKRYLKIYVFLFSGHWNCFLSQMTSLCHVVKCSSTHQLTAQRQSRGLRSYQRCRGTPFGQPLFPPIPSAARLRLPNNGVNCHTH